MSRLLTSAAVIALMCSAAFAADIPVYEPPPQIAPVAPAFDWSGFYIGVHGGYGWGDVEDEFGTEVDGIDGGIFGGQIGVNWQWNWIVLGLEGDGSWSGLEEDESPGLAGVEIDWLASARGRVGLGFDRFLIYGTGGAGFGGIEATLAGASDDNTHFGWVAGGGGEVLLTQNVSVGVEYLHYDFGEEEYNLGGGPFDADGTVDVVRGRLNWKFGGLAGM